MLGFPKKLCLIFTIVLSTDIEFIMGRPVNNAKLNSLLEKYLRRYGYLKPATKVLPHLRASWDQDLTQSSMEGDPEIRKAIRKLQRIVGLPVTGKITDEETVKIINQMRCGMKDFHAGKRTKRFTLEGTFWKSKDLTYKIQSFSSDLSREDTEKTIGKALQMWSNASQLTFTRVSTPGVKVDLNIKFVSGFHGDNHPTDGPGMELAHAFFPLHNKGLAGDVHFDDDETFSINGRPGVDLLWLAVHELGHSLGLEHTYHPNAVMFPYYTGYRPNLRLSSDDRNGIQRLYGSKTDPTLRIPTSPAVLHESAPLLCSLQKIDAAVRTKNGNLYVFNGAYFWQLERSGLVSEALRIREKWVGLEDNIDAALTRRKNGKTYFFKGSKYWIFSNRAALEGPLDIANLSLPNGLQSMDAAFELPREDGAYFFKGDKYWRYNWSTAAVDKGYPQTISTFWKGLPNDVDAAFQWKRGRVVILKGDAYYPLKHKGKIGVKNASPKMFSSNWLGCSVKNLGEQ